MTRKAVIFLSLGITLLLTGGFLILKILFFSSRSGPAALQIHSFPKAEVYVNNQRVGETPYSNEKLSPGDSVVKLRAASGETEFVWEQKVRLTSDTLTYINRELGKDNFSSAGEILFLERLPVPDKAEIAVVSEPPGASLKIDGAEKGVAPTTITNVLPGDHELLVSLVGFRDRIIHPRILAGYRLNVVVSQSKTGQEVAVTSPTPTPATPSGTMAKPYATIKNTPTGWLRVRTSPSTAASESGRVDPGKSFPLLDEQNEWVKIKTENAEGWVSKSYVSISR